MLRWQSDNTGVDCGSKRQSAMEKFVTPCGRTPQDFSIIRIRLEPVRSQPAGSCASTHSETFDVNMSTVISRHGAWLSLTEIRSAVYRTNEIGPRTDPCDTSHIMRVMRPRRTHCFRNEKYERNRWWAAPLMPNVNCKRCSRMLWSNVSKAADRSKGTSALKSRRSTVSVKWLGLSRHYYRPLIGVTLNHFVVVLLMQHLFIPNCLQAQWFAL